MKEKIRVALLAGGKSAEREVSLNGAVGVEAALDREKYEIRRYDPATDLVKLAVDAPELDVAFILLHGPLGEDGTMQGFLDLLELPYQGSGVLGSALAMNKNLAKILYRQAGLKVADWLMVSPGDENQLDPLLEKISLPLVIKPVHQGSSVGMSIARTPGELKTGLDKAFIYDREVMLEEYIEGREITGGVIGNDDVTSLPLVEIIPGSDHPFFDYEAKYTEGASREICPADLSNDITARARQNAVKAHEVLQLRGYSRTDMIVSQNDEIFIIETNTIPGMTPTSLLPQAAQAHGLSFSELLDRLFSLALEKK
ncbi:MAG: D-alanine--D-alanine ligase [Thermodesulfobacteriota bacterium]|nr:D-alanine--D-alanine ligase [Thermodesulfobacteriota bacterium]